MHPDHPPHVYAHYDFRLYLSRWWDHQRSIDPELSKSELSRRLGLPNTRSYFSDVLAGKRVSELFVDRFVEMLGLDEGESKYFRALVQFNQADDLIDREAAFERLVSLHRSRSWATNPRLVEFYRDWWHGALLELLSRSPQPGDWAKLGATLQPAITAEQAKASVDLMTSLGFLVQDPEGNWRPPGDRDPREIQVHNAFVQNLQRQQVELSRRIMLREVEAPREFSTTLLRVKPDALDAVQDRIDRFRKEIRELSGSSSGEPDAATFVLCLGFFPLASESEHGPP